MSFFFINWQATELEDKLPLHLASSIPFLSLLDLSTGTSMAKRAFWSSAVQD